MKRSSTRGRFGALVGALLLAGAATAQTSTLLEQPYGVHHGAARGLSGGPIHSIAADREGRVYVVDAGRLMELQPTERSGSLTQRIAQLSAATWSEVASEGRRFDGGLLAATSRGVVGVTADRDRAWSKHQGDVHGGGRTIHQAGNATLGTPFLALDDTIVLLDPTLQLDLSGLLAEGETGTPESWSFAVDGRGERLALGLRGDDPRGLRLAEAPELEPRYLLPRDGHRDWTPRDVRAVHFDAAGRLWFATPQGVGVYEISRDRYRLWGPADGLPWSDVTALASRPGDTEPSIWIGTTRGLVHLRADLDEPTRSTWEVRQGPRWLPHDHVHDLAFDKLGGLWAATEGGVGHIAFLQTTLSNKALYFARVIDRLHQRTEYGYVDARHLTSPDADPATGTLHSSDNDGLWTSMYGASQVLAWASTRDEEALRRARKAFRAVAFLSEVTQGGTPAMQPGFPARSILPTSGPNPNDGQAERDRETQTRDRKWKSLMPRWGTSADGRWYWKADTSSDELDGHFFFYALYYDLVADDAEKPAVRAVVHRIVDHLLRNDFSLVDHDGRHTRWAVFGPSALNDDPSWWEERGLNSMSVLSYLRVAEHVSASASEGRRYRDAAQDLIERHGYAANARHPKVHEGPGTGNQSDDEMALMNLYHLLRYETDADLAAQWAHALDRYWINMKDERNPLFHYLYAGALQGREIRYRDAYDDFVVEPRGDVWRTDSLDALVRYPLDRRDWPLRNSDRHDVVLLRSSGSGRPRGHRADGKVLPIDERFVGHWNHDPWSLDHGGRGTRVSDGASYLLPYYLGLYHGFLSAEDP